jgi:glucosamine--fructose-6-phosphate aminotransferase (isomerizing)
MNNFLRDILDQPTSLGKAFQSYITAENIKKMEALAASDFDNIIFAGMGSSHDACYGASIYLNQLGYQAAVFSAGQLLHYQLGLIHKRTLLVLVSQSGESGEIVHLISQIPTEYKVIAITNNPESTLGKRGNCTLILNVAPEESVSTRTYGSSLILLNLIAKAIAKKLDKSAIHEIESVLSDMGKMLQNYQALQKQLQDFLQSPPYLVLLGRGYSYSSIFAGGLFIKEVAKYPSISLDSAEFRHGPLEMVGSSFHGIIFAPDGPIYDLNYKLAMDIVAKKGKVVFITNNRSVSASDLFLPIQLESHAEMIMPIIDIIPIQFIANRLAETKGFEPGKFRWSSKITAVE